LDGHIGCDSAAAIGIINRTGAGKLRHIKVQYLWLQQRVREGDLQVSKVPGVDNPADLFTKHLDEETMKKHLARLGFQIKTDRAASAPTLNSVREGDEHTKNEPYADEWRIEGETAVRQHLKPRYELFTPLRVRGAPPAKALTPMRVSEGTLEDGTPMRHIDSWTARATAHARMPQRWTGTTTFYFKSTKGVGAR
jgi:hypothetical protein